MISSVTFWPRWRAECERFTSQQAVISITDPGQVAARIDGEPEVLRLDFYDITETAPDDARFGPETLFTAEKASKLAAFVEKLNAAPGSVDVVVHCEAGICRSAAVALFVEATSKCAFATREKADLANPLVLAVLSALSGLELTAAPPFKPAAGIILF